MWVLQHIVTFTAFCGYFYSPKGKLADTYTDDTIMLPLEKLGVWKRLTSLTLNLLVQRLSVIKVYNHIRLSVTGLTCIETCGFDLLYLV